MNRLLLIIVALLCMPAFTELIQACECREYRTPICARFWRSDAVFVGQVIDIRPLKKKPDDLYTYLMVRFMLQESFQERQSQTDVSYVQHSFDYRATYSKDKMASW